MAFSGEGAGTEGDPYVITTVAQLQEMNDDLDAYYILGNNINATATSGWNGGEGFIPILVLPTTKFTGSLDGQGYRITGLFINRPTGNYQGLFGYIGTGGVVKNVKLYDVAIIARQFVGGIAGANDGVVSNYCSTGTIYASNQSTGGLIGINGTDSTGSIDDCYSTCSVSGVSSKGGLVGVNNFEGTITNCYSIGRVDATGGYIGGLIGNDDGVTTNSFWDTETSGQETSGGGTGKTTEQMKDVRTYTFLEWSGEGLEAPVWDFRGDPYDDALTEDIWDIGSVLNDGYPYFNIGAISPYAANLDALKKRLLIPITDTNYDEDLTSALKEAARYASIQILNWDAEFSQINIEIDSALFDAILDIAAGIFKRRHMPQDMDQGWWAHGIKKLNDYITATYIKSTIYFPEEE
jgi:hypothetical protein